MRIWGFASRLCASTAPGGSSAVRMTNSVKGEATKAARSETPKTRNHFHTAHAATTTCVYVSDAASA